MFKQSLAMLKRHTQPDWVSINLKKTTNRAGYDDKKVA
jgi:hypothetical protein